MKMPKTVRPREPSLVKEEHVQRTVVEFLELDGWRAIRTDPVSRREWGKGFGEVGMPDYLFVRYTTECIQGRDAIEDAIWDAEVLWIEFKAPGKKPRADQLAWHEVERQRGALVLVVDDIDAFAAWYKASGLRRR